MRYVPPKNDATALLERIIKDLGYWDGCDEIELTEYCKGCKHEEFCEKLR